MNAAAVLAVIFAALIAIPLAVVLIIYVVVPLLRLVVRLVGHIFRFIGHTITDLLRIIGALVTGLVLVPLVVVNIVIGRWSASSHYGRAFQGEVRNAALALYRVVIAHPARLLGLAALTEGLEKRLPEVVAAAPGRDAPSRRAGAFAGYDIVGSLAGGGSGGKLYIARPDAAKLAAFRRSGQEDVREVVIKSFSLSDGSSLPQIIRESRALDAAKRLGLVLDHELTDERFFYVMRYVPGEALGLVTQRLHAASGPDGLGQGQLQQSLSFAADLLRTLDVYHQGGLWHKDVKPDNIIVDGSRAHLVDLGLITPLRSAMTLTTHGTEYFRDPEMVRLALRGVKVHQVNGAKFDIYAAGAVLFSVVEGSFPAHGGLSQISKRCPESVRWVVRRAMTDYDRRYATASEMLADVEHILGARDPFAVKPIELPSMGGTPAAADRVEQAASPVPPPLPGTRAAAAPTPPVPESPAPPGPRSRPNIRVADWWTGRYTVEGGSRGAQPRPAPAGGAQAADVPNGAAFRPIRGASPYPAHEQIRRARERAAAVRERALNHPKRRPTPSRAQAQYSSGPNAGMVIAVLLFLAVGVFGGLSVLRQARLGIGEFRGEFARSDRPATPTPGADYGHPSMMATSIAGERLIVLRDPVSFAPGARERIEPILDELEGRGFELVGAYEPEDPSEAAAQTELLAGIRKALGLAPFKSDEARQTIASWFSQHDEAPLLLWIGRDPDGDEPAAWLVERADAADDVVFEARRIVEGIY